MGPDREHTSVRTRIERQRRLPFAKAVEISLKSIKVRFWRSMLTVSSIVLAIAFLMWQLTSAEIVRSLETMAKTPTKVDADAAHLKTKWDSLDAQYTDLTAEKKPIKDRYKKAQARLDLGLARGKLEEAQSPHDAAKNAYEAADRAFKDQAIQATKGKYDGFQKQLMRLTRLRKEADEGAPPAKQLDEQIRDLKRQIDDLEKADEYEAFRACEGNRQTAQDQLNQAKMNLDGARKHADAQYLAAKNVFEQIGEPLPDQKPAPKGSAEEASLFAERSAAKELNDEAETLLADAEARRDRAKERYKRNNAEGLDQLLVGVRSADEKVVSLPWGLPPLTSSRVWIISLALLVCLVGISNAMLMSVTERYREIGTMKCLGALDNFIVKIFLLESSFMGSIGVLLGVILGFALAFLVQWNNFGAFVTRYFPAVGILTWALVAFVIGAALSVLGGILPAQRAARMAPVEAMRIEE